MLDRARTYLTDVGAITTAELGSLAKEYLGRARVSRATVLPIATPAAEKRESPQAK
jgi:hypothetical protein